MSFRSFSRFHFTTAALFALLLTACSDNDEPDLTVPPQSYDSRYVEMTVKLGELTPFASSSEAIKNRWEVGDHIYLSYTKTFSTDDEIINEFTVTDVDAADESLATVSCPKFITPRGVETGRLVYAASKKISSLAAMDAHSMDFSRQHQTGNNTISHLKDYLHLTSLPINFLKRTEVVEMKHSCSVITLAIKRPDGWAGELTKVTMTLDSRNVRFAGCRENKIDVELENCRWNDEDMILVNVAVIMEGRVNPGNTITITATDSDSRTFSITRVPAQWDPAYHYSALVSTNPADYENAVEITLPGFVNGGSAF